jgi:hypothetical protein
VSLPEELAMVIYIYRFLLRDMIEYSVSKGKIDLEK